MMRFLLPILLLLLLLPSCAKQPKTERVLIVSIEPLRYVTEALAGDKFEVKTITPKGANPETYSPTLQQMEDLASCTAYIRVGTLGFEKTQLRAFGENCPHLYIVNASEKVSEVSPCGDEDHGGEIDPHTWMSPRNMNIIALNIYKALCHMDHANMGYYEERLNAFLHKSDSISREVNRRLARVKHRTFLINHPSLGHFALQYKLRQISVEHEGKEASVDRVQTLISECRKDSVRVILCQEQHSDRTTQTIAQELGLPIRSINPLTYDWDQEIIRIADLIAQ